MYACVCFVDCFVASNKPRLSFYEATFRGQLTIDLYEIDHQADTATEQPHGDPSLSLSLYFLF